MMNKHGGDIYGYPGVVDFSANINYLGMPQAVKAAAMRGVEESVHYPQAAHRQLRYAVAKRYHIEEDQILCGNGAAELIYCLVEALQPKRALVMAPSFSEYEEALDSCGCEVLRYLLKKEDAFCPDEGFIRQIQPSIDMVFVCNPNNPTGGLVSISYIEEVCRMCEKEGAILVVDESFLEFVSQAVSARALLKKYESIAVFYEDICNARTSVRLCLLWQRVHGGAATEKVTAMECVFTSAICGNCSHAGERVCRSIGAADCTGKRISHRTITSCGAGERCRTDCI